MTQNSTTSKRSTASDTATAKSKSSSQKRSDKKRSGKKRSDIDQLMDLYWGGSERRITGLTLRIISVNAAALSILIFGVIFLGQYQNTLIKEKLKAFASEVELVSAALSESAISTNQDTASISPALASPMMARFEQIMDHRIYLFDKKGALLLDSRTLKSQQKLIFLKDAGQSKNSLYTVEILKKMTAFVLKIIPSQKTLPNYPAIQSTQARDYPDALRAMQGRASLSAWNNKDDKVILSAAIPLVVDDTFMGAVLVTREAKDLEKDISDIWVRILNIFFVTLVVTILLSIYLSGLIARPLRKLATAAEAVRKGKSSEIEIPDLSYRNDEIGELSLVLRDMTSALHDRMNMIESFSADVAHELKNPLTSLKSAVETVGIVTKKKDREQLLNIIKHDIDRLDRLITDISAASRLDTELARENIQRLDLRLILRHVVDIYKDPLARSQGNPSSWNSISKIEGITLSLESDLESELFVWGLEGRLGQIFENLISNALSFSTAGGHVRIQVSVAGKRAIITIEDEGVGIPENKLETIFERFYSERPHHEAFGRHSGLGLSICRQIITALDGRLFAENIKDEEGNIKGARFTVILNRT